MRRPKVVLCLGFAISMMGCRQVKFTSIEEISVPSQAVSPEIPEIAKPIQKTGECELNQKISSCLSCDYDLPTEPEPVLSKAQKLAKIMSLACQIPNRSYPADYTAPSAAQIWNHVAACTDELYPETPVSNAQLETLMRLLDTKDQALRNKMFKGLWYQPPHSDHFELYFGINVDEVVYSLCMGQKRLPEFLFTSEYAKASQHPGTLDQWRRNPAAQKRWNDAQEIRQQLLSCYDQPAPPPTPAPAPSHPAKNCSWKSFEGSLAAGGYKEILQLLKQGYKLSLERSNSCEQITSIEQVRDLQDQVRIVGYKCE